MKCVARSRPRRPWICAAKYANTQPTAHWAPEVSVWYNDIDLHRPDFDTGNNGDFNSANTAYDFKAPNTLRIGKGKPTAGVDGSRTNLDLNTCQLSSFDYKKNSGNTKSTLGVKEHDEQLGLYTQLRMNFDAGFSLSTGARYDWHAFHAQDGKTEKDGGLSGNATLSYLLGNHAEAYVAASHTFLCYQWSQAGLYHARDYVTAENFKAASAQNKKIGINVFGSQWKAGIGYFDTKLMERTELTSGTASWTGKGLRRNHADDLRSRGWLLHAAYQFQHTQVGMNATLAKVTQGNAADALLPEGGDAMPVGNIATFHVDHQVPAWNAKFGANLRVPDKEKFSDKALASGFTEQGTYAVVGAYGEWQPHGNDQLRLRLGVDNLFNRQYYTRSTYPLPPGKVTPIMASGRAVNVSAIWKF